MVLPSGEWYMQIADHLCNSLFSICSPSTKQSNEDYVLGQLIFVAWVTPKINNRF